jgi:uncharacterized membrane protein YgcG
MTILYPTSLRHLAVGFLIGLSFMEANLMLIVAVISGANLSKLCVGAAPPSATATEAFATMLFLAFSSFTAFVFLWKDILLPASADGGGMAAHDGGLPPSSYGGGGGGVIGGGAGDGGFSDGGGSATGSTAL